MTATTTPGWEVTGPPEMLAAVADELDLPYAGTPTKVFAGDDGVPHVVSFTLTVTTDLTVAGPTVVGDEDAATHNATPYEVALAGVRESHRPPIALHRAAYVARCLARRPSPGVERATTSWRTRRLRLPSTRPLAGAITRHGPPALLRVGPEKVPTV